MLGEEIAEVDANLDQALRLLQGLGIGVMCGTEASALERPFQSEGGAPPADESKGSLMIPSLLSNSHRSRFDTRSYDADQGAFRCAITYNSVPPDFFDRLIVRMRPFATRCDFNSVQGAGASCAKRAKMRSAAD